MYVVKIDNRIAMYPEKIPRVEHFLEVLHRLPN